MGFYRSSLRDDAIKPYTLCGPPHKRSTRGNNTSRCSSSSFVIRSLIRSSRSQFCQRKNATTSASGPYCLSNSQQIGHVHAGPPREEKAARPGLLRAGRIGALNADLALEHDAEVGVQDGDAREDVQVDHRAAVGDAVLHRDPHGDVVVDADVRQHAHRVVGDGQGTGHQGDGVPVEGQVQRRPGRGSTCRRWRQPAPAADPRRSSAGRRSDR